LHFDGSYHKTFLNGLLLIKNLGTNFPTILCHAMSPVNNNQPNHFIGCKGR
jgi:hypothetical protein